jgi:chemotaxis receptor (MCP) glutamine deamidase CheD
MRPAESGLSAMCHCLLSTMPATGRRANERANEQDWRHAYMDLAIEDMLNYFRRAGIMPGPLGVKMFRGAEVLKVLSGPKSVARENVRVAQQLISQNGLRLVASDVGGQVGLKITFITQTGEMRVRRMRAAHDRETNLLM